MKAHKHIVYFIAVFLWCSSLMAQKYSFEKFSTEQGLAQSQVYAMDQDQDHYLWIGTLDGLSKFDGKKIKNFYIEDGLQSNTINDIFCINNETWIATDNGICVIVNDKIIPIANNIDVSELIIIDSSLIFSSKNQLFKVELSTYQLIQPSALILLDELPARTKINQFNLIDNILYIATNKGGYTLIENKLNELEYCKDIKVTSIKKDSNNTFWVATLRDGLIKVINNKLEYNYTTEKDNITNDYIRDLLIDNNNNVWITTKGGLSKIQYNGDVINYTEQNGFNYVAETIFQDEEGNIWIGSEGKGIIRFVNEAYSYLTTKQGLKSDLMLSFVQDNDSNMWFSSYGDGLTKQVNEIFEFYNTDNSQLSNNTVWSSYKAKDGKLWFGTSDGLCLYNGASFVNYTTRDGLPHNKVQALYEDNNTLWVGTYRGVVCIENGVIKPKSWNVRKVRSFCKTEQNLYIASSEGLYFIDKSLSINQFNDSLLNGKTIFSLQYYNNCLWIGAEDGLYKKTNNTIERVTVSKTKSNFASINFLLIDRDYFLWVGTNSGIYTINLNSNKLETKAYTISDGLIGMETNQNAIYQDISGKVWIGTSEGVSVFNRANATIKDEFDLTIDIDEVKLFYLENNLLFENVNTFKYFNNNFTFHYNAPYFQNPDAVTYSFFLEGIDDEWSKPDENGFTRYANLPHGTFTFKVKATIDNKKWTNPASYSFTITPPFWLTWWFRIATLVIVFGFVYIMLKRQRSRQHEKRKAEILTYKNKLIKLEQQSLNASMNRHFIFNALNSIQFYINKEDKLSANKYLSSFAKLIRKNLDSSVNEDNLISLTEEMDRLGLYLSLEKMRFKEKFDYEIDIDPNIDPEATKVPGMFLQPFVENSIWHGILPSENPGKIWVLVEKHDNGLKFIIHDNGIGIDKSIENKKDQFKTHTSRGMIIASNRIAMLEKITGKSITIDGPKQLNEKGESKGTIVEIVFS